MLNLTKRNNVYYLDYYEGDKRIRRTTKESSYEAAKKIALKIATKIAESRPVDKTRVNLGQALANIDSGLAGIKGNKDSLLSFFGPTQVLSEITQDQVDRYRAAIKQQSDIYKAPSTRNKKLMALSTVLKQHRIKTDLEFPLEREDNARQFIFDDEQIEQIVNYFDRDSYMKDLFIYLLDTGCRLSEALRLSKDDIRLDAGLITIWVTKTKEPRSVPITKKVREILDRRPEGFINGYVKDTVQRKFKRCKDTIGLPEDAVLYSCRHSYATKMLERGVDIQLLAKILGHSSLAMTSRYSKVTDVRLMDALAKFDG
jgi:integrase